MSVSEARPVHKELITMMTTTIVKQSRILGIQRRIKNDACGMQALTATQVSYLDYLTNLGFVRPDGLSDDEKLEVHVAFWKAYCACDDAARLADIHLPGREIVETAINVYKAQLNGVLRSSKRTISAMKAADRTEEIKVIAGLDLDIAKLQKGTDAYTMAEAVIAAYATTQGIRRAAEEARRVMGDKFCNGRPNAVKHGEWLAKQALYKAQQAVNQAVNNDISMMITADDETRHILNTLP